jgi:hypothetical protein
VGDGDALESSAVRVQALASRPGGEVVTGLFERAALLFVLVRGGLLGGESGGLSEGAV